MDTHVVIRWLSDPRRISRGQRRIIEDALRKQMHLGISAISLVEMAFLSQGSKLKMDVDELFDEFEASPAFRVIPITSEIAREAVALAGALRDPGDSVIVATARIHRLTLLTVDDRIIDSHLVPVVE